MENQGKFRFWSFDKRCHYQSNFLEQISATDIQKCKDCEWWLYHKLSQPKVVSKSVYLMMGSVFHSVVENDLRFFVKRGVHYNWFDIEKYFNSAWDREKQNCDFSKLAEDKAKIKCKNYIQVYYQKAIKLLYPLNQECIERFFCVPISYYDKKLKITGKVDVIGCDLWIVDHKTSSRPWERQDAEKEAQAIIYPYCIKNQGYDIQGFRYNVVSGVQVESISIPFNQAKLKEWLIFAFDIKKHIEEGNILRAKVKRQCDFCDFNKICEQKLT